VSAARPLPLTLRDVRMMAHGRLPGQVVIQLTDRCNARCPQCGMRADRRFRRTRLSEGQIRRILDHAAATGVGAVSFTGGEPLIYLDELLAGIRYAGRVGIRMIRTGTNGFLFQRAAARGGFEARVGQLARALAATPLRNLWISIDSAIPEVHDGMRGFPGLYAAVERALPVLHRHGIFPAANLGINRNMAPETMELGGLRPECGPEERLVFKSALRGAFRTYFERVARMGFTMANACYPMGAAGDEEGVVYQATSSDHLVRFTAEEKALVYRALCDVLPEFRTRLRIFTPRSALLSLCRQHTGAAALAYPCRGGVDYFFVDSAGGVAFPCGFRGDDGLGAYVALDPGALEAPGSCRECDWECFRDPSELLGPVLQGLTAPVSLLSRVARDPGYFRVWLDDLRYYRACGFFDGRRPPDLARLARYRAAPAPAC
jgi:hypothetical protein